MNPCKGSPENASSRRAQQGKGLERQMEATRVLKEKRCLCVCMCVWLGEVTPLFVHVILDIGSTFHGGTLIYRRK